MKIKTVCHSNNITHDGFLKFKRSMDFFNYDYIALNDPNYNWAVTFDIYLKYAKSIANDYTHILTTDCWDVIAFGGEDEIMDKYRHPQDGLFSVEKACFPNQDLASDYPNTQFAWKYINCGGTLFPIDLFIKTFEKYTADINIQEWAAKHYLYGKSNLRLDTDCSIFQTVGFEREGDFSFHSRGVFNNHTKTHPVLIHGNGRTNMYKYYKFWEDSFL